MPFAYSRLEVVSLGWRKEFPIFHGLSFSYMGQLESSICILVSGHLCILWKIFEIMYVEDLCNRLLLKPLPDQFFIFPDVLCINI